MQCPICHEETPGDGKFCTKCGNRLRSLPGGGPAEQPSSANDLREDQDPQPPEAERRGDEAEPGAFCVSWLRVGTGIGIILVLACVITFSTLFGWLSGRSLNGSAPESPARMQEGQGGGSACTSPDQWLADRLGASLSRRGVSLPVRVLDVQLDPRDSRAIVTISLEDPRSLSKDTVLRAAYEVATGIEPGWGIRQVTVRLIGMVGGRGERKLLFVGDLFPDLLPKEPPGNGAMADAIQDPWWNPDLQIQ